MPARAALFDLDGTLIDSSADIAAAANVARAAAGLPPLPEGVIAGYVGDGAEKLIERAVPDGDRVRAMAAFTAHYAAHCTERTRPYPGIPQALTALRDAGWILGVVSNKPDAFSVAILERLGLLPLFAGVRGGDRAKKPDPAALDELFAAFGAAPAASWMVGDHVTDIRAARAAGCRIAWCGWGIGRREGLAVDVEVATPAGLPGALAP